ncbi:MFS transporter [Megasphaera paucivorans]|uniref:MFS transporter, ACS family, glucarate transporter n=1 Tax=Megasphaera paucivorans TaxID=349095 RepID=A0A1H0BN63_9FIRM|nr:MFS transporter [Megasphaera paucivorans]SDN47005.1 MFS transporter, ACS family, glucarate transporter [Megasphaera paucivorans]
MENVRTHARYGVGLMMLFAIVINYLDRTVMSAAAPAIMNDLHITDASMGLIMSAFFFSYAVFQIPSGWLADRIGQRICLGISVLWWSLATVSTALARTPFSFISARIFMGVGEAGAYPCNAGITAKWFPDDERGKMTAIFDSGSRFGTAFAMPLVVWVISQFSWHVAFIICGSLGVLWSLVWFWYYNDPEKSRFINEEELKYIHGGQKRVQDNDKTQPMKWYQLFRYRNVIAMCTGFFTLNYSIYFFITWFPTYLVRERGISFAAMGFLAMLPPLVGIFAEWFGGWFQDHMYKKTHSLDTARKINLVGGMLLSTTIAFAGLFDNIVVLMTLLCLTYAGLAFAASAVWCLPGDVAPKNMVSVLGGVQNCISNCGGILGPIITGFIITASGSFMPALVVSGVFCFVGAMNYLFVLREIKPIEVIE